MTPDTRPELVGTLAAGSARDAPLQFSAPPADGSGPVATSPVLVLELNELCPPLIERFIAAGDLPAFARLRARSATFVTDAGEDVEHLNPWIQWVTVHTGASFAEHGVFKLGEGATLGQRTIADHVGRAGGSVWLCGPMNVVPRDPVAGAWLPDPWNPDRAPEPGELEPFARFVRGNVQEHTNPAHRSTPGDAAAFVRFMARHGLSGATLREVAAQLAGERTGRRLRWRRAALLDRFQWDLFASEWRRRRPTFATYFSNTTAHFQHLYWRHMDPTAFVLQPTDEELRTFGGAVREGYREMDRIVGLALDLVGDHATLVLCTALSQQPYLGMEQGDGKRFHRAHDLGALLDRLGVVGATGVAPVMSEQFHVYFADEDAAVEAERRLGAARVDGGPLLATRRVGTDVFAGCPITEAVDPAAVVTPAAPGPPVAFGELFYRSETAKSGYHHPHGAFWVRGPGIAPGDHPTPVPLRAVAPTLLGLLGIDDVPGLAAGLLAPSA